MIDLSHSGYCLCLQVIMCSPMNPQISTKLSPLEAFPSPSKVHTSHRPEKVSQKGKTDHRASDSQGQLKIHSWLNMWIDLYQPSLGSHEDSSNHDVLSVQWHTLNASTNSGCRRLRNSRSLSPLAGSLQLRMLGQAFQTRKLPSSRTAVLNL